VRAQSESERAARLHTLSSIVGHVLCSAAHEVHAYGGRGSAGICTRECRRARDRSCALGAIGAIGAIRATSADQHRHEQTSPSHARQLAQSRGELQAFSTFSSSRDISGNWCGLRAWLCRLALLCAARGTDARCEVRGWLGLAHSPAGWRARVGRSRSRSAARTTATFPRAVKSRIEGRWRGQNGRGRSAHDVCCLARSLRSTESCPARALTWTTGAGRFRSKGAPPSAR